MILYYIAVYEDAVRPKRAGEAHHGMCGFIAMCCVVAACCVSAVRLVCYCVYDVIASLL